MGESFGQPTHSDRLTSYVLADNLQGMDAS